jgi:hypothetical protein
MVRLTRKLAEQLDGIDVFALGEGDVLELSRVQRTVRDEE